MSKTLALGVVLGATLSGTFGSTLGMAKNTLNSLGSTVKILERDFKALKKEQTSFDKGNFTGPVRQIANYKQLSSTLLEAKKNSEALTKSLRAHKEAKVYRQNIVNDIRSTAMTGAAVAAPLVGSVKALMDQEEASTNMKMAYMKAGGGVSEAFEAIRLKAVDLGNALPGTTADFMNLGRVLKERGLSDSVINSGGLDASAKLNVLLGLSQEAGGEFLATMIKARGLSETELAAAADSVQRAKFAFGLTADDMQGSMKYDAPMMNALGLKGGDNLNKLLSLQAMGKGVGINGEQWGTQMRAISLNMGSGVDSVKHATKGEKAVARRQMEQSGVDFKFYDDKGQFKGMDNFVSELEKLKVIKDKLGVKAEMNVAEQIFGKENASAVLAMADQGKKGYDENLKKMDEQASLSERINEQSKSLNVLWESLTGTVVNLAASLGSVFGEDLKSGFKAANDFVGNTLMPWVTENKGLIKTVVSLGVGFLGMKMAVGGVKLMFSSTIGEGIRFASTAMNGYKTFKKLHEINKLMGRGKLFSLLQSVGIPEGLLTFGKKFGALIGKGFLSAGKAGLSFFKFTWSATKTAGLLFKGMAQGIFGVAKAYSSMFKMLGKGTFNLAKILGLKTLNLGKFLVFKGASGLMSGLRLAGRGLGVVMRVGGALARVMGGTLVKGLGLAGRAVMFLGRALLMNPIGIAVAVIAGAAYLIWKNWDKLKPWFVKMWAGVKAVFSAAFGVLKSLFLNFTPLGLVISHWNILGPYFSKLWSSIKTYAAAAWIGIKVVWSGVGAFFSAKVTQIKSFFSNLPSVFAEFGRNIIQGLIDGITAKWDALRAKISSMASMVSDVFTKYHRIESPSRRFAQYGGYLMEGLGVGIGRETPAILQKMGGVARSISASFAPKLTTPAIVAPKNEVRSGLSLGGVPTPSNAGLH